MEFITDTGPRSSRKATPTVILITNGVGKRTWVWWQTSAIMTKQNGGLWSTLHPMPVWLSWAQCSGSKAIHQYPLHSLRNLLAPLPQCQYSLWGASSIQFPPDCLSIWRLPPYSKTKVLLPHKEEEIRFKVYTHTREVLLKISKEGNCLSDPVSLSIPLSALLPHLEETTQTGEELGYNPALQQLQEFHQARTHLESELGEAAQKLAHSTMIIRPSWCKNTNRNEQNWPSKTTHHCKRSLL